MMLLLLSCLHHPAPAPAPPDAAAVVPDERLALPDPCAGLDVSGLRAGGWSAGMTITVTTPSGPVPALVETPAALASLLALCGAEGD